jgi:hypothetical protein
MNLGKRNIDEEEVTETKTVFEIPHTIPLQYPVEWCKEVKSEIIINRRLIVEDLASMPTENHRFGDFIPLISKVTGESQKLIGRLDASDLKNVIEVVSSFF